MNSTVPSKIEKPTRTFVPHSGWHLQFKSFDFRKQQRKETIRDTKQTVNRKIV